MLFVHSAFLLYSFCAHILLQDCFVLFVCIIIIIIIIIQPAIKLSTDLHLLIESTWNNCQKVLLSTQ